MTDTLFETVREYVVEKAGEDWGWPTTVYVEELVYRIRGIEPNSAEWMALMAPGERILLLSLIRKEIRKIDKDRKRLDDKFEDSKWGFLNDRQRVLKNMYRRLGGDPGRLNEAVRTRGR